MTFFKVLTEDRAEGKNLPSSAVKINFILNYFKECYKHLEFI